MATIKAIVMENLQRKGSSTNDDVRNWLLPILKTICAALPGENNPEVNPIGAEFSDIMFLGESRFISEKKEVIEGKDLHEKGINKLIAKILEERDDLCDYPNLRQKIVDVIKCGR